MHEVVGNLWETGADAIVITTNGFIKKNGHAVMGAGVAKQALRKWPNLSLVLGEHIRDNGNCVGSTRTSAERIVFFPVKHAWYEKADLELITRSTKELVKMADRIGWQAVVLPRPGCGNGGLDWKDVKPILESYLDERFTVVNLK